MKFATDLRVICDGTGRTSHTPVELALLNVVPPDLDAKGMSIESNTEPPSFRGREVIAVAETSRATNRTRGKRMPGRQTIRTPLEAITRADGGRTFQVPGCPRCRRREVLIRDETVREYIEKTRGTPMEGCLNVAYVPVL